MQRYGLIYLVGFIVRSYRSTLVQFLRKHSKHFIRISRVCEQDPVSRDHFLDPLNTSFLAHALIDQKAIVHPTVGPSCSHPRLEL